MGLPLEAGWGGAKFGIQIEALVHERFIPAELIGTSLTLPLSGEGFLGGEILGCGTAISGRSSGVPHPVASILGTELRLT